jgi:hypothetical protein
MRPEDVGDYLTLRRVAANPWQTLRFRKTRARHCACARAPALRGDSNDFTSPPHLPATSTV